MLVSNIRKCALSCRQSILSMLFKPKMAQPIWLDECLVYVSHGHVNNTFIKVLCSWESLSCRRNRDCELLLIFYLFFRDVDRQQPNSIYHWWHEHQLFLIDQNLSIMQESCIVYRGCNNCEKWQHTQNISFFPLFCCLSIHNTLSWYLRRRRWRTELSRNQFWWKFCRETMQTSPFDL